MKRILLFVLTNVAVIAVMSIVLSVLGVDRFLSAQGLDVGMLLVFSLVVGFTGAIFSLLISKPMAKWSTGAQVIEQPRNDLERWLVATVKRQAQAADRLVDGDRGKEQVANLHFILSKAQVRARPSVLWCYSHDLGFSTHRQKRMRQIKKLQESFFQVIMTIGKNYKSVCAAEYTPHSLIPNAPRMPNLRLRNTLCY
jgi:hypothetical protein